MQADDIIPTEDDSCSGKFIIYQQANISNNRIRLHVENAREKVKV